jgi:DNA-binding HxlR family transcriptional regulator
MVGNSEALRRNRQSSNSRSSEHGADSRQAEPGASSTTVRRSRKTGSQASSEFLNFDRLVHEQIRLGILSALAGTDTLTFNDLKRLLKTTDGNLSVHARKLEEANYISCNKYFAGRLPRTEYRLTSAGRQALRKYLDHMETLIKATREH